MIRMHLHNFAQKELFVGEQNNIKNICCLKGFKEMLELCPPIDVTKNFESHSS